MNVAKHSYGSEDLHVVDIIHSADREHRKRPLRLRIGQLGERLAFQALRTLVFVHDRTRTVEWLLGARGRNLGRIELSPQQQQAGWQVAVDRAGYCYAYFQEDEATDRTLQAIA